MAMHRGFGRRLLYVGPGFYHLGLSVKAQAGPCRTEPTIVTEVGLRRMTVFGTGFYNLIKSEVKMNKSH